MKDWIMCLPYWIHYPRSVMRNLYNYLSAGGTTKIMLTFIVLLLALHSPAYSQSNNDQQWWFNVELIVFKRTLLPTHGENFEQAQFELKTSNANDLLYLAALKQASEHLSLSSALPMCNPKPDSDSRFGVTFNFEYSPETTYTPVDVVTTSHIQTAPVSAIVSSADDEQTSEIDNVVVSLSKSNQSMIKALIAPFVIENTANKGEIENVIGTLTNLAEQHENLESIAEQDRFTSLNSQIMILSQQLQQNKGNISQLSCLQTEPQQAELKQFALAKIGPQIFSKSSHFAGTSQLISAQETVMQDYAKKVFRQRDIQPLLYTAWRQKVEFGIENAEFYRVLAGNKLETSHKLDYETWHEQYRPKEINDPQDDESIFFDDLRKALESNDSIDWLTIESLGEKGDDTPFMALQKYELEGQLKVYLDYVNQVPYLHIDSEFMHYRLVLDDEGSSFLESFPLKQKRRVISKQIHYFDHPAFGLIVRLERFTPPLVDDGLIE